MPDLINGEVPIGWEFTTLGAICERGGGSIQTGPFGSQLHASDYVPVGVPSVMPVNIGDNRIVDDGIARITEDDAERLSRHRLRPGDIVYSRRGDVERRALVRNAQDGWLCGTGCLKVRFGTGVVDPLFASLYLGHPAVRQWIVQHAVGATMPNLNTGIMSSIPFALPPLPEQERIAHVLGTLDDKIELNRRMNATLEAMSRAIFKSWFVDFDPVRQKAAGKQPVGMDAETAALFPDSFEHSELGEVPAGWGVSEIRELLSLSRESLKPADHPEEVFAHYSLPAFDSGQWPANNLGSDIKSQKLIVQPGCVLISKLNPRTPRVWLPQQPINHRSIASTEFLVCSPNKETGAGDALIWCVGTNTNFIDYLTSLASGTSNSHQRVRPSDFLDYTMALPTSEVLIAFDAIVAPVLEKVRTARKQSRTLAALRDTLLPKLLSGEIRVPEAEEAVEEAVG